MTGPSAPFSVRVGALLFWVKRKAANSFQERVTAGGLGSIDEQDSAKEI